jgi:hypothetical protein
MRSIVTNPLIASAVVFPLLALVGALQLKALRRYPGRSWILLFCSAIWLAAFLTIVGARFALLRS